VHDQVDRLGDEVVQGGDGELCCRLGELCDEAQPGERLASAAGMDRGVAGDAGRQREQERQRFSAAA
jgi:hypothetical protein